MTLSRLPRLIAYNAQPIAPISSGQSLRRTLLPVSNSSALTMESFRIVPPCTTI